MLCYSSAFILTARNFFYVWKQNSTQSVLYATAIPPSLHADVSLATVRNCGIASVFLSSSFNFALFCFFFCCFFSALSVTVRNSLQVVRLCRRTDGQSKHRRRKKDTKQHKNPPKESEKKNEDWDAALCWVCLCVCDVHIHQRQPVLSRTAVFFFFFL